VQISPQKWGLLLSLFLCLRPSALPRLTLTIIYPLSIRTGGESCIVICYLFRRSLAKHEWLVVDILVLQIHFGLLTFTIWVISYLVAFVAIRAMLYQCQIARVHICGLLAPRYRID
jgi:hypothetical protein